MHYDSHGDDGPVVPAPPLPRLTVTSRVEAQVASDKAFALLLPQLHAWKIDMNLGCTFQRACSSRRVVLHVS
eukprot:723237-Rhodomonas_salina.1